jgi:uncharacterized protein YqeY
VSITERVQTDLAAAAKARDQQRLSALRLVLDALKKAAKDARGELDEAGEIVVLGRERKRRLEAAEAYRSGGRDELAAAEEAEAGVIDEYLPTRMPQDELEALVNEAVSQSGATSEREIGKIMSLVMPKVAGRADGKQVSDIVRRKLAGAAPVARE